MPAFIERSANLAMLTEDLTRLQCPVPFVSPEVLLYPGQTRYSTLEWLFGRLLGEKSPFVFELGQSQDEQSRTKRLADAAQFLQFCQSPDEELIQGSGSISDRVHFLLPIIECVDATQHPITHESSTDEQADRNIQLLDSICEQRQQVFSDECHLFPRDITGSDGQLLDRTFLEAQLTKYIDELERLQQTLQDLSSREKADQPNGGQVGASTELQGTLDKFLGSAERFDSIYKKEIEHWAKAVEKPVLHTFGSDSHQVLQAYTAVKQLSMSIHQIRASASILTSNQPVFGITGMGPAEPSKAVQAELQLLIRQCESAIVALDDNLRTLQSASLRRQ